MSESLYTREAEHITHRLAECEVERVDPEQARSPFKANAHSSQKPYSQTLTLKRSCESVRVETAEHVNRKVPTSPAAPEAAGARSFAFWDRCPKEYGFWTLKPKP